MSNTTDHLKQQAREQLQRTGEATAVSARQATQHYVKEPAADIFKLLGDYAREKPDVAACWCFALGVIVGWKLRP